MIENMICKKKIDSEILSNENYYYSIKKAFPYFTSEYKQYFSDMINSFKYELINKIKYKWFNLLNQTQI